MQSITKESSNTLEVKQCKFIAYLVPYDLYESTLNKLKEEHPKARHFVTAYRYLNEYSQVVEHSSDDGEPKGTSGRPSLMVLQGQNLINAAVIVVRYFGGTKLGTGGLVRAYSDVVNLVIANVSLYTYKEEISKSIAFKYSNIRLVDYECGIYNITVVNKSFEDDTFYTIKAAKEVMDVFLTKLQRIVEVKTTYQK